MNTFQKIVAGNLLAAIFLGGLATETSLAAAPVWKGPKDVALEKPFYPKAKRVAKKAAEQQEKIDEKWDKIFKKYKGYSSENMK